MEVKDDVRKASQENVSLAQLYKQPQTYVSRQTPLISATGKIVVPETNVVMEEVSYRGVVMALRRANVISKEQYRIARALPQNTQDSLFEQYRDGGLDQVTHSLLENLAHSAPAVIALIEEQADSDFEAEQAEEDLIKSRPRTIPSDDTESRSQPSVAGGAREVSYTASAMMQKPLPAPGTLQADDASTPTATGRHERSPSYTYTASAQMINKPLPWPPSTTSPDTPKAKDDTCTPVNEPNSEPSSSDSATRRMLELNRMRESLISRQTRVDDESKGRVSLGLEEEPFADDLANFEPHAHTIIRTCCVCGVLETDAGCLYWCTGCRAVLYCGQECQAASWRAGHDRVCRDLAIFTVDATRTLGVTSGNFRRSVGLTPHEADLVTLQDQHLVDSDDERQ